MSKTSSTIHYYPAAQKTVSRKAAILVFVGTLGAAVALIMTAR
jgi:hypothetical protein